MCCYGELINVRVESVTLLRQIIYSLRIVSRVNCFFIRLILITSKLTWCLSIILRRFGQDMEKRRLLVTSPDQFSDRLINERVCVRVYLLL